MPLSTVLDSYKSSASLSGICLDIQKSQVLEVLTNNKASEVIIDAVANVFKEDPITTTLQSLNTKFKLESYFHENFSLPRTKNVHSRDGKYIGKYINISDVLKLIFADRTFQKVKVKERSDAQVQFIRDTGVFNP